MKYWSVIRHAWSQNNVVKVEKSVLHCVNENISDGKVTAKSIVRSSARAVNLCKQNTEECVAFKEKLVNNQ